jgi:ribosome-associated toxin RatA of RatAB toxin-antitoxin module
VPVYKGTREIDIAAPPEACFAVLTDYDHLPDWLRMVRGCEVLSRDEQGRAAEVEYEIDAVLRRVTYRLRHLYDEPVWVGSEYLGGDFECFEGSWRFDAQESATHVTFNLRIDPGLRVPGRIAKLLNDAVMGQSVRDLAARVQAVSGGRP